MQNDTTKNKTESIKLSDKKSLNINLASLESNGMIDDIFGMTASVETNYHIASNKIDRIFDGNSIHFNEVKYSTYGDSEQLKDYCGRINPDTVSTRLQDIQIYQNSPQRQCTWDVLYFL